MKGLFTLRKITLTAAICGAINLNATTNHVAEFTDSTEGIQLHGAVLNTPIRTVEFWFKPQVDFQVGSHSEFQAIVARDNFNQNEEWGFFLNHSDGHLKFYRRIGPTQYEIKSDSTHWSSTKYYHVVGTIDTTNGMALFVDGIKQTETNSSTAPIGDFADETYIGKWGELNIRKFKGRLDDFKMWSKAMSDTEVTALTCGMPSDTTSLRYWLNMEVLDPMNPIAKDQSSNGFDSKVFGKLEKVQEVFCIPLSNNSTPRHDQESMVWPNPSNGIFNLNTDNGAQVSIFNAVGEQVQSFYSNGTLAQFQLKNKGVYFVVVNNTDNKRTIRVVKQ